MGRRLQMMVLEYKAPYYNRKPKKRPIIMVEVQSLGLVYRIAHMSSGHGFIMLAVVW